MQSLFSPLREQQSSTTTKSRTSNKSTTRLSSSPPTSPSRKPKRDFGGGMTKSMKAKAHVTFSITEAAHHNHQRKGGKNKNDDSSSAMMMMNSSGVLGLDHHHDEKLASTRRHYSRFYKLWKKAGLCVLFFVRIKLIMIREKVTRLTKEEVDQIKSRFRSFIPQFGAITAGKTGEFFRYVGVSLSDVDGEQAALSALAKAGKGDSDRMKKTELTLTQILKMAQVLKRQNAEVAVSEEELAFEAVREWMITRQHQQQLEKDPKAAAQQQQQQRQFAKRRPSSAAANYDQMQSALLAQQQKEKEQNIKVTEQDVHECLSSFGVVPAGFTEAGIREQENQRIRLAKLRRSQQLHQFGSLNNFPEEVQTPLMKSARGGSSEVDTANQSTNNTTDDLDSSNAHQQQHNQGSTTTPTTSARGMEHSPSSTTLMTMHAAMGRTNSVFMMGGATSTTNFPRQNTSTAAPPPPPPSESPIPLSTFKDVFFQPSTFDSSVPSLLMMNGPSKTNSNNKNQNNSSSATSSPTKDGNKNHSSSNNTTNKNEITAGGKRRNSILSGNNGNNTNSKSSQNLIESLLSGGDGEHTLRQHHRNIDDDEEYEETEQEKIGKILRSITVNMELPSSLALNPPPIEPSYEMRDWRDRKELKKMNAAKNRFDAESEVGRGTGVRVLPTKIGTRIMSEAASFKAQVTKASDDALLRAVQKNVKETIVDKAALESKMRFRSYRRTKEEDDAAKEFLAAKKHHREQYGSRSMMSLTPQPGAASSSGSRSHIQVVRNLSEDDQKQKLQQDQLSEADSDSMPSWMKRARKRRNFVPFMSRPIPRSELSRHLREALPSKTPDELCKPVAFQLSAEQRMQLGAKMSQDQQQLQQDLLQEQQMQAQNSSYSYQGDARMAASVLLDALEIRQRDEEMQHQDQQQRAQQQLLSAPYQPDWAQNNSSSPGGGYHQPRASSMPM